MNVRIALANLQFPETPDQAVVLCERAIREAGERQCDVICFPECYLPGYRGRNAMPPPDPQWLDRAWSRLSAAARAANTGVVLGTERLVKGHLVATALILGKTGEVLGFQDKVQIDPSEEGTYTPGVERHVFQIDGLTLGVAICHEGWRYPETVRWAAYRGAQVVFHPHFHAAESGGYSPVQFADPANSFHEKAALCRAAENTCYFATVNYASAGSPTTSAIVRPDGTLLSYQPYGEEGLLVADLDLNAATRLLALRWKAAP